MKKFKLAPQERIEGYESTAREFFRTVLDLDYRECVVTDQSRLVDFASCGLPEGLADGSGSLAASYEAWDAWVVQTLCSRYGVGIVSPSLVLVDLFEQIEAARRRVLQ